jgi:hypothetical protein
MPLTTEELYDLAHRFGCVDENGRFVLSRSALVRFAEDIRARAFRELHQYAVGPVELDAIERFPPQLVETMKDRPLAVRLPDHEFMEAIGYAEWTPRSVALARRTEYLVWKINRLQVPEDQ